MFDKRYKVTQEQVTQMRDLRKQGVTYQRIGDQFGVSCSAAMYWCDERQRNNKRITNAKRKKTEEELERAMPYEKERRLERVKNNPKRRLLNRINSMISDKRTRYSAYGIPKGYCIKLKETGVLRTPNIKII